MGSDLGKALNHQYVCRPGGDPRPSVTTVINAMIHKPAFAWAASELAAKATWDGIQDFNSIVSDERAKGNLVRVNGEKIPVDQATDEQVFLHWARKQFWVEWQKKADQGQLVHQMAEQLAAGQSLELPEDAKVGRWLQTLWDTLNPTVLKSETILAWQAPDPRHDTGGRLDAIWELDVSYGGKIYQGTYLVDFKTGALGFDLEKALQVTAYAHMREVVFDDQGNFSSTCPLPPIDKAVLVYLNPDGWMMQDVWDIWPVEKLWATFVLLRTTYEEIKTLERIYDDRIRLTTEAV